MWFFLTERNVLYASAAICLSAILYLSLNQRQRDAVVSRLPLRRRRASHADTPPRSLSPEKKVPSNTTPGPNEYVTQFPPSQREVLLELAQSFPSEQRQALG